MRYGSLDVFVRWIILPHAQKSMQSLHYVFYEVKNLIKRLVIIPTKLVKYRKYIITRSTSLEHWTQASIPLNKSLKSQGAH